MEALLFPILVPAADQHGLDPGHLTTSLLLQLITGFNQEQPSHRTIGVAIDLTAAFDAVNQNVLLSKIAWSILLEATCLWLSNHIRDRQSVTSLQKRISNARIIHAGVPQGSNLLPIAIQFLVADMPRPTEPLS